MCISPSWGHPGDPSPLILPPVLPRPLRVCLGCPICFIVPLGAAWEPLCASQDSPYSSWCLSGHPRSHHLPFGAAQELLCASVPKGWPHWPGPTLAPRRWGAQQWQGTVFPRMEVGQGQLPWCWCWDSSRPSPSPRFKACAPPWLSPGCPRMGMPFPSQSPLQPLAFLPAGFSIPSCPSTVCRPCSRAG